MEKKKRSTQRQGDLFSTDVAQLQWHDLPVATGRNIDKLLSQLMLGIVNQSSMQEVTDGVKDQS